MTCMKRQISPEFTCIMCLKSSLKSCGYYGYPKLGKGDHEGRWKVATSNIF